VKKYFGEANLPSGAEQAAQKGLHSTRMPEKRPSGAKAHVDLIAVAARLKSCPVTKPSHAPP
jgi:hypothetical protein